MVKVTKSMEEFYTERSRQIYELRNSQNIKKEEKKQIKLQEELLKFLKARLSNDEYAIAWNFINNFAEQCSYVSGLWNEKFYFSGINDASK